MRIKVTEVGQVTKEGTFFQYTLKYVDLSNNKDFTRKMVGIKDAKLSYDAFKNAKPGELFDVNVVKNENGFWVWESVAKIDGDAPLAPSAPTTKTGTWETPEERARKQILIVRQSCLAQAVPLVIASNADGLTTQAVLDVAGEFEDWVNRE